MSFLNRNQSVKFALCLSTALGGAVLPQAVAAQDDIAFNAEEIFVTARRQTESLQDVPLTVSVISGNTLNAYQINEVADLQSRIPGLNVQTGGSGAGGQLSLRGVGSSNLSAAFDSAVAFNFDGVILTTMRMVQAGFFDTKQVEVLKGPQSLYFGKSASAGVLSIKSNDPSDELEVQARASYEFEEQGYLVEGIVSGPVSDTIGFRLGAQYNGIDKYVELAPGTPAVNQNRGLDTLILRGTLDWEPSDSFYANLKANYLSVKGDGSVQHTDIDCGANGVAEPSVLLGGARVIPVSYDCNSKDQLYDTTDGSPALVGQLPLQARGADTFDGTPFSDTEIFSVRLAMDYDINESLTVNTITGYVDLDSYEFDCFSYNGVGPVTAGGVPVTTGALAGINGVNSPQGAGCSDPQNTLQQFSQEIRLSSNFDGPFNFMIGAFYEDRVIDFRTSQQGANIAILAGPDAATGSTFDWFRTQRTDATAISLFASGDFEITDRLTLAGGVRWTDESKTAVIDVPFVHAALGNGAGTFVAGGFNSGDFDFDDSRWTPEVTLTYELSDNINVYGAFKTGFKSGGIDNSALPSNSLLGFNAAPGSDERQEAIDGLTFNSETSSGGEIGMKALLADGALTLNTTIYRYVFKDLQLQNFLAAQVQFETLNASEVTTQGVEVDWRLLTGVDGLTLSGAASLLDAEFSEAFATSEGTDLKGRNAPRAPDFAGNFAVDYRTSVSNSLDLGMSGNVAYVGTYFLDQGGLDDPQQDSYVTLDAAISLSAPDAGWQVSLAATNLTNKIWNNTSSGRPFIPAGSDDTVVTQNRGRQIFLEAKMAF